MIHDRLKVRKTHSIRTAAFIPLQHSCRFPASGRQFITVCSTPGLPACLEGPGSAASARSGWCLYAGCSCQPTGRRLLLSSVCRKCIDATKNAGPQACTKTAPICNSKPSFVYDSGHACGDEAKTWPQVLYTVQSCCQQESTTQRNISNCTELVITAAP